MNEKEMIEEMAKDMFDYARTFVSIQTATEDSKFINVYKEALTGYAKYLIKQDYGKLLEGSVVLTKEEYEKLKTLYDCCGGYMTSQIGDLPLTVEGLRNAVDEITRLNRVEADLQELNAKYYNEAKDLRRKLKQVRKETAKEILQELYCLPHEYHEKKILELANQFGVEV